MIVKAGKFDHWSLLFTELGIDTFPNCVRKFNCIMMHKVLNGLAASYIADRLLAFTTVHGHNTRDSSTDLILPRVQHGFGETTFTFSA